MNRAEREGLAERLADDRERLLARFVEAARRLRHRGDPAAAHDVRVALRQLEATLDLWRGSLPRRHRRRAARAIRRLRRALGPVGEAWTILTLLEERTPALAPADRAIALEIARHARLRVGKFERRSAVLCTRRRVRRLRALYAGAWPARQGRGAPGSSWLPPARERLAGRRALAAAALRKGRALVTDEALHAARLAVKRWRYASERLGAGVPAAGASSRDWLKAVQQTLGRISDLRLLRAGIVLWTRKHGPSEAAPAPCGGLLDEIQAERSRCVEELHRLLSGRRLSPGPAAAPTAREPRGR